MTKAMPTQLPRLVPGERLDDPSELLRATGRCAAPDVATEHVRRHHDVIFVRVEPDTEAHFCIRRAGTHRGENVAAHLDWDDGTTVLLTPPRELHLFVEEVDRSAVYVGSASPSQYGAGKSQFSIPGLPRELDALLRRRPDATPIDGAALTAALLNGAERMSLALQLAASWLGPLPAADAPRVSRGASSDIRWWHSLWARLATFHDHPWCCWPACWEASDAELELFQSEWQNGGTFGARGDAVWLHPWWHSRPPAPLRCAEDMGEFALQFLIYGLTGASDGYFVEVRSDRAPPELRDALPLLPWSDFMDARVEFVGGEGFVGTLAQGFLTLRVDTHARMLALMRTLGSP